MHTIPARDDSRWIAALKWDVRRRGVEGSYANIKLLAHFHSLDE